MISALLRRFRTDRTGSVAIEFALLGVIFMTIIFAILETALVFCAQLLLDRAVMDGARQVQVGIVQRRNLTSDEFRALLCEKASFLFDCSRLMIDLRRYARFADVPKSPPMSGASLDTSGFTYQLVAPETIAAVRVFYVWPIGVDLARPLLAGDGGGGRVLAATYAFRTEPFR